jgi:hypothetical protein
MKSKLISIIILLGLCSCNNQTPNFSNEGNPFVVGLIVKITDSTVRYQANHFNGLDKTAAGEYAEIIGRRGIYNIGDTIKLNK